MSSAASSLSTLFGNQLCEDFMAFVDDEQSLGICRDAVHAREWPEDAVQDGGINTAISRIEPGAAPKIVVADISRSLDPEGDVLRLARKMGPNKSLIVLGASNDVGVFRQMMASGASDYLAKPLVSEMLADAIDNVDRKSLLQADAQTSRLTVVIGVRGGVGASSIATNLAWIMAHEQKLNTALLDLDLHFGTTTLSLDLETGAGLREVLESPHRLDRLFLDSTMVKDGDKLAVLGAEEPIEEMVNFDESSIDTLIGEVSQDYNQVVVDLPRHQLPMQGGLMASADTVVLVSDQSLAGIRDINRIAQAMKSLSTKGEILKVVSRAGNDRAAQVSKADFERGLNDKISYLVPEDAKTLTICANAGKAIADVAPKAPITKALRELAAKVSNYSKPKKKGFLSLIGGGKKSKTEASKA